MEYKETVVMGMIYTQKFNAYSSYIHDTGGPPLAGFQLAQSLI